MKTVYQKITLWTVGMAIIGMYSCSPINYRILTTIHPDGSCLREIAAKGDSAFLTGDWSKNPYLFHLDSSWQITPISFHHNRHDFNVEIGKTFHSINEISSGLQLDEDLRPLAAPMETFQKHFRWFYTYYSFKTVYPAIPLQLPVPIDRYLNKPEQKLWLQGDLSAYAGMNGIELKEEMDNIENRFWKWVTRNVYESTFDAICDFEQLSGDGKYLSQIQAVRDTLFQTLFSKSTLDDHSINTVSICQELDKYCNTQYFSGLYQHNQYQIDSLVTIKSEYIDNVIDKLYIVDDMKYELVIPGKLIFSNAPVNRQDTLVWKVNAFRFTSDDYELIATSRTVHVWAFALTFLLVVLSVFCLIKVKRV
jgi:hypothetical protein